MYDSDRSEYNKRVRSCVESSWEAHGVFVDAIADDVEALEGEDTDSEEEGEEGGAAAASSSSSSAAAGGAAAGSA